MASPRAHKPVYTEKPIPLGVLINHAAEALSFFTMRLTHINNTIAVLQEKKDALHDLFKQLPHRHDAAEPTDWAQDDHHYLTECRFKAGKTHYKITMPKWVSKLVKKQLRPRKMPGILFDAAAAFYEGVAAAIEGISIEQELTKRINWLLSEPQALARPRHRRRSGINCACNCPDGVIRAAPPATCTGYWHGTCGPDHHPGPKGKPVK